MEVLVTTKQSIQLENRLCVDLGFCSMGEAFDELIQELPTELEEFVNGIFVAEGLEPEYAEKRLWRQVRDIVLEAHIASTNDGT